MTTEVFFRNPALYIREVVELGANWVAWDRGYLRKKAIEPSKHADLNFPRSVEYRSLVIGEQGTAELRRGHTLQNPVAVYPSWEYGQQTGDELVELLVHPLGESREACADETVPPDERPVLGQEHRVVILRPPVVSSGPGRKFIRFLQELQEEFPEAIIHLHGLYSYRAMFGCGFRAVDVDSRARAAKGDVELPNGRYMPHERAARTPQWVNMLGYSTTDLKVARNRCMFNMKSAWWAAEHFGENIAFKSRERGGESDPVELDEIVHVPATTSAIKSTQLASTVGDKFLCNLCSLQNTCKFFRDGGVCSIPETEPAPLAKFFKTRDSATIIEGLGTLLAAQTSRLAKGMEYEADDGELSPEVTKILNSLFSNGVKLAKLVDPRLAAAGATKVNMNQVNLGAGGSATPQAFMASVIAELEAKGYKREEITEELVMSMMAGQPGAITASASASSG